MSDILVCKFIVNCITPLNVLFFILSGGASVTVPVYIAETAPSNIRGRLVTVNNLFITGGQFIASVVDGIFSPYKRTGWRYLNNSL